LLNKALRAAHRITDEKSRAELLMALALAPESPSSLLKEALQATQDIADEDCRAAVLKALALAPQLPVQLVEKVLKAAEHIADESRRLAMFTALALAPEISALSVEEFLKSAQSAGLEVEILQMLRAWIRFPKTRRAAAIKETLQLLQRLGSNADADFLHGMLMLQFPEFGRAGLQDLLQGAQSMDEKMRAERFAIMVPFLPEQLRSGPLLSWLLSTSWQDREALLSILQEFFPALAQLGGSSELAEVKRAICDTARWFP
jgi:hypothetical protein